jgi:hypothetical protein
MGLATLLAVALSGAAVTAQGNKGPAVQPVGTLQIDSLGGGAIGPIYSFGFEATNSTTSSGGGGGAGKATLTDVQVSRLPDVISPALFRAGLTGIHIPVVRMTVFGASKNAPDSTYVLNDVLISGFSSADGLERVSFKFRTIEMLVGGSQFCYDLSTNSAC